MEAEKTDKISSLPKIAIVVLNYKGGEDTIECLESLQQVQYSDFTMIVVDNGSADGSLEMIRKWAAGGQPIVSGYCKYDAGKKPVFLVEYSQVEAEAGGLSEAEKQLEQLPSDRRVVLIRNDQNLGFSGGNNVGARYAVSKGYEYVVLLNNDTIVINCDFLHKIREAFCIDNKASIVGPRIVNMAGAFDGPYLYESYWGEVIMLTLKNQVRKWLGCSPVYLDMGAIYSPTPVVVYKISGACMAVKSDFLKSIGFLDEKVWLSCEEAVIAEQVIARREKIYFQPQTLLLHKKAQSPRPNSSRKLILRNHFKQREYFLRTYRKYGSLKMILVRLTHRVRLIVEDLRGVA